MRDPRSSPSPYGVLDFLPWNHDWNHFHYGAEKAIHAADLMAQAGVRWVRMDFLWQDIEPEEGWMTFARYDRLVRTLRARGLSILGVLNYSPRWAAADWRQAPQASLYARYARSVVHHFKTDVQYWEIWNEPDHAEYWLPQDGMAAYTRLLQMTCSLLKEEDPTCRVLLGGLSPGIPKSLKQIYEQGGGKFFDVANIHPFINPVSPDALGALKYIHDQTLAIMKANGDATKPIWWTEIGCPGLKQPGSKPEWWMGKNPSEAHQAGWVETVYTKALHWPRLEKIFWAFFRDAPNHFNTAVDAFGLVHEDFSPKPAYEAYKKVALA